LAGRIQKLLDFRDAVYVRTRPFSGNLLKEQPIGGQLCYGDTRALEISGNNSGDVQTVVSLR
jgi:hypothetical protein